VSKTPEPDVPTLPDLLSDGLAVVFVGINPSLFSVARGHYFARPSNRFWRGFSRSRLSRSARAALGVTLLTPEHDRALLAHGFGFTDAVKRPTGGAADLAPRELAAGVNALTAKLERYRPRIACFHGITGYRAVHRVLAPEAPPPALGWQSARIGATRLFVMPNPSGANPQARALHEWYDRLALDAEAAAP
jgi:TDG/mug DNA glycosylase family protein